jgi:ABC-type molybdate transport system permease subunit
MSTSHPESEGAGLNPECEGGTDMNRTAMLAIALALLSAWVVLAVSVTAVWLAEQVRVVGLVIAPAIAASLLVLYFGWRGRLTRLARGDHDAREAFDQAA